MPSEPYTIRSNDRVMTPGKTGSGKSALLQKLVWEPLDRVVYFDMTGDESEHLHAPVLRDLGDVHHALFAEDPEERLDKLVYSPEVPTLDGFDRLCEYVYKAGNTHLIADELMAVYRTSGGGGSKPTTANHLKLLSNGRKRGSGFSGATQRPYNIPLESISEAEHIFVFRLKLPDDRDRMKRVIGPAANRSMDLDPYHYIYDHDALEEPEEHPPLDL